MTEEQRFYNKKLFSFSNSLLDTPAALALCAKEPSTRKVQIYGWN